ncbi:hypothetical protein [Saccharopolyspora pogona]|nr:hypothetical protein [Saccharopolyspora pogona]
MIGETVLDILSSCNEDSEIRWQLYPDVCGYLPVGGYVRRHPKTQERGFR